MPGTTPSSKLYLRLRGGKKIRYSAESGLFKQFYQFQQTTFASPRRHVTQHNEGVTAKWKQIDISTAAYTLADLLTISQDYGWSSGSYAAVTTVRDKLFLFNGLGVRAGDSKPPFSSWDGSAIRYVGIDAYTSGTNPSATFTPGSAGTDRNNIVFKVSIYVGLHNTTTQHFSNGVFCGTLTPSSPGTSEQGKISVADLANLIPAYNNATEQGELKYVFYATVDGGRVPYLILNAALNDIFTVSIASASADLNLTSIAPQGFVLDLTKEMPRENYPPRHMSQVAYANGRVYGVLSGGGSGTSGYLPDQVTPGTSDPGYYRDFQYPISAKDGGAIVWSGPAAGIAEAETLGIPEESWPHRNRKYAPNGEYPVVIDAAPGGSQLLVITPTATFLLSEMADGTHVWDTISDTDGCQGFATYTRTRRGPMWITQKFELVLLDRESLRLTVLSEPFSELLKASGYGAVGTACDYVWDPKNQIEVYKVWREAIAGEGNCVVFDFVIGGAYEEDSVVTYSAKTMLDPVGNVHHLQAFSSIWGQEADPFTSLIYTRDELETDVFTEINGDYISQWIAGGRDPREMAQLTDVDVIGDGDISAALSARPITVTTYMNLASNTFSFDLEKSLSNQTDLNFKARRRDLPGYWFKFRLQLAGHGADGTTTYPDSPSSSGELTVSPFGRIYDFAPSIQPTNKRD